MVGDATVGIEDGRMLCDARGSAAEMVRPDVTTVSPKLEAEGTTGVTSESESEVTAPSGNDETCVGKDGSRLEREPESETLVTGGRRELVVIVSSKVFNAVPEMLLSDGSCVALAETNGTDKLEGGADGIVTGLSRSRLDNVFDSILAGSPFELEPGTIVRSVGILVGSPLELEAGGIVTSVGMLQGSSFELEPGRTVTSVGMLADSRLGLEFEINVGADNEFVSRLEGAPAVGRPKSEALVVVKTVTVKGSGIYMTVTAPSQTA